MSLFKEWNELINNQTDDTFEAFWKEYAGTEQRIYQKILAIYPEHLKGTFDELVKEFDANKVIFMGFMDGINSSLKKENDLESVTEDTALDFDIDYEKLFFNMLKADADYLYTLQEWENVLTVDKMKEIVKDYNRSKIVHVEKKPGRNEPCPCGSGKKYKNCCGKNA
ncbi:MAG: SEC-C domain-containing protein [Clostridia bacterium]|nr:SEC-C domain-containing protein [Clostridia bacterium]